MTIFIIWIYLYAYAQNCKNSLDSNFTYFIVSNSNTLLVGLDMQTESNAVHCETHPAWTKNIPGATWIWDRYNVSTLTTRQTLKFRSYIGIPGVPLAVTLTIACDNSCSATINGKNSGCQGASYSDGSVKKCNLLPFLVSGINTAEFIVTNYEGHAGLLYMIEIITSI